MVQKNKQANKRFVSGSFNIRWKTADLWKFSTLGKNEKKKKMAQLFFQYLAAKKVELMKLPRALRNAAEKETKMRP